MTSDTTRACVAHTEPEPEVLATPVSFDTDVAPILTKSCAFASCHGSRNPAVNRGVFLAATSADDVALVKSGLTNMSRALPSMPYVTPGNWKDSFLMHKLDGDLCVLEERCADGSCGSTMPEGNELLPETSRDAIRRWIAQGAK